MYFLSSSDKTLPPAALIKNGCDDVFFMPMDERTLIRRLRKDLENEGDKPLLQSVPLDDLAAGTNVDFSVSVFLPMNKKYVKILKPGDQVRENQLQKINTQDIGEVYVDQKDLDKFVKYANANKTSGSGSRFEAKQKLEHSVRSSFHELLSAPPTMNFDEGKRFLSTVSDLIEPVVTYAKKAGLRTEIFKGLNSADVDLYERSSRVATLAACISAHIGKSSPESMAMAGLLMDVSLAHLPMSLQLKEHHRMSQEEKAVYEKHPTESLKLLQERKMVLPNDVMDAISQHHERMDSTGFPKQLPSHKISVGAQILYITDRIVDLTILKPGQKHLNTDEIFDVLFADHGASRQLVIEIKKQVESKAA